MKKIVFIVLVFVLGCFGDTIKVVNGKVKTFDTHKIPAKYIEKFSLYEPYENKTYTFEGISLKNLANLYGNNPSKIEMTAIDFFESKFDANDILDGRWILVFKQNGKYMTPLQKGPARMVDKTFKKNQEKLTFFDKWVWMIEEIKFQ